MTTVRYLPEGFVEPTTPSEALKLAKHMLRNKQNWAQGFMFESRDIDMSDDSGKSLNTEYRGHRPFDHAWKCCSIGAVFASTVGISRTMGGTWRAVGGHLADKNTVLYNRTIQLLESVVPQNGQLPPLSDGTPDKVFISDYNDAPETKHEDVLAMFDSAIAVADAVKVFA